MVMCPRPPEFFLVDFCEHSNDEETGLFFRGSKDEDPVPNAITEANNYGCTDPHNSHVMHDGDLDEVVKIILEYKKDIWKNDKLFKIVEEYFGSSLQNPDFCTALKKCFKGARESQIVLHIALRRLEEEGTNEERSRGEYENILDKLMHFKDVVNSFTKEYFTMFQSVYKQQVSMLEKLKKKKKKLDTKLRLIKAWRKVLIVIFVSVFALVLISSVVAAAVPAPAFITALLASAAAAMGPMGKWCNTCWNDYINALKAHKELLNTMQAGTHVAVSNLERLKVQTVSLLQNVEFGLREEEAGKFVIEKIKKKLELFMRSVEDLRKQADWCSRDIRRARTVVLKRIIRHPN